MSTQNRAFDTTRSDAQDAAFRSRKFVARRRVIRFERNVPATPEEIFPQLCPVRECDWIDGWSSELVYSDSGYGEDMCVFRTTDANVTGPGLWTFSHVEAPVLLKIVRVAPPFLQHLTIDLSAREDGTTDTRWTATITALSADGNRALDELPQNDDAFAGSADALVHWFREGSMQRAGKAAHGGRHSGGGTPAHGLLSEAVRWVRNHTTG
jgi:hypothetical protein